MSEEAGSPDHVTIRIRDSEGNGFFFFRIKRKTPMQKLMETYSVRLGISSGILHLLYDGERVKPDMTADDVFQTLIVQKYTLLINFTAGLGRQRHDRRSHFGR